MFSGLLFVSCSEAQHSNTTNEMKSTETSTASPQEKTVITKVLPANEFQALIGKEGYQLVDVRTPQEYNAGKIGDAKNINFFDPDFKTQIAELDMTKPVLIYCASGNRSGKATLIMKEMGFTEIYDLRGGYGSWPFK